MLLACPVYCRSATTVVTVSDNKRRQFSASLQQTIYFIIASHSAHHSAVHLGAHLRALTLTSCIPRLQYFYYNSPFSPLSVMSLIYSPGPAAYDVGSTIGHAPKVSMKGRYKAPDTSVLPGPGECGRAVCERMQRMRVEMHARLTLTHTYCYIPCFSALQVPIHIRLRSVKRLLNSQFDQRHICRPIIIHRIRHRVSV